MAAMDTDKIKVFGARLKVDSTGKLAELERLKRAEELDEIRGGKQNVGFGSQIRSYVLHPYQMVKDLRTEHEVGNPESVFNGEIDGFLEAGIRWRKQREK